MDLNASKNGNMSHMRFILSACACDILLCGRDLRALACASSACEKVEPCHAGLKSLDQNDQNPKSMGESELIINNQNS